MDSKLLVEENIEDGRRLIASASRGDLAVLGGAWMKDREGRAWRLYVVADSAERDVEKETFSIAHHLLEGLGGVSLGLLDIRFVTSASPVGRELIKLRDQHPSLVATKLRARRRVGSIDVCGLYLYPDDSAMPEPPPIVRSVLRMLGRGATAPPSVVTFRDGSQIHAVPVGIRLNTPDGARIDWHDVVTSQDRTIPAAEVVSIH